LIGILVGSSLLGGLIGVLQSYFSNRISQSIMFDLRNQLFDRVLKQSMAFFTGTRTGDVMSRLSNDVNGVQSVVSDTIFSLVNTWSFWQHGGADVRARLEADDRGPARTAGPSCCRRARSARPRSRPQGDPGKAFGDDRLYAGDTRDLRMQLVKAFVRQSAETLRFPQAQRRAAPAQHSPVDDRPLVLHADGCARHAGPAVLWLFGGYLVVTGQESLGHGGHLCDRPPGAPLRPGGLARELQVNVVGSLALFQRIFEYMDLPVVIDQKADGVHLDEARGQVEFDQVTFRYGLTDRPALIDVSFKIEPGQLAALVGPTGAGKTTITNLLPRFYDPQLGAVRLDGYDVRDLTLESLGRQVGMVFQDTFPLHASIRDNLLYAKPDATEAEMVAAAKAAYIDDFIASLPKATTRWWGSGGIG